jgi:formamidopyrimidine-DNA glycosylase
LEFEMPELPEVETFARHLKPLLIGKTILSADLRWKRTLALPSPKKFKEQIAGQKILAVSRRGKFLNIQLNDYSLLIHLRMTGDLLLRASTIRASKHDRLVIQLSGKQALAFNDTRKFGRVWFTANPNEVFARLGPEPFSKEFTAQWLYTALQKKNRQLKPLLLDQTFLAGLGNIYTDEALHIAKLHPAAASDSVTRKQAEALHEAIRNVLKAGIRHNGASIDWAYRGGQFQNHFRVYDREGQPCPVCGAEIQKIIIGQRGTHICPQCQSVR